MSYEVELQTILQISQEKKIIVLKKMGKKLEEWSSDKNTDMKK